MMECMKESGGMSFNEHIFQNWINSYLDLDLDSDLEWVSASIFSKIELIPFAAPKRVETGENQNLQKMNRKCGKQV